MISFSNPLHISLCFGFMAITACCPVNKQLLGDPRNPYPIDSQPKVGEIIHLPTGKLVNEKELMAVAGDARVVYIGETHDNPASHRMELEVLKSLSEIHPQKLALGMEMFVRSQQPALDRWIAGKLDEKKFLRESHWYENWNIDFAYYRDLLNFTRDHRIPIIALNAGKELVYAARVKHSDQLSTAYQALLPEMDMTDPYQRAMVAAYFSDHAHGEMELDGFIRAQTVWDETMAESVARYLASPEGKEMHLLVIAGGNHVNYGFGIPRRVFRRFPSSYITIGGREIRIPKDKKPEMMNVTLPIFPMVSYDFLEYIDYEDLPESGVHLGVMIEPAKQGRGLVVREIVSGSNAAQAGLQKDDLLLTLDGETLKDNLDLIYALKQKHPGDRMTLEVERHGKAIYVDVLIPPSEEKDHQGKQQQ
jgi:uncharacterized iron-regulated protein